MKTMFKIGAWSMVKMILIQDLMFFVTFTLRLFFVLPFLAIFASNFLSLDFFIFFFLRLFFVLQFSNFVSRLLRKQK